MGSRQPRDRDGGLLGLAIGGASALAVGRLVQSEYHGIRGIDRLAFGASAALFLAAMLLASVIHGLRASRTDPMDNLRDV